MRLPLFKSFFSVLFLLLFASCQRDMLSVHTDYVTIENLASYHVDTPDPLLYNPPIGQRLIVYWRVPEKLVRQQALSLLLTLRFRNKEEVKETVFIDRPVGKTIYSLLDADYFEKRGILTYKVELFNEEDLLKTWKHQLWTELITFPAVDSGLQDN